MTLVNFGGLLVYATFERVKYLEMCSDRGQRGFGDETKVCRARSRVSRFRFKLFTQLVEIELLLAEPQSLTIPLDTTGRPSREV